MRATWGFIAGAEMEELLALGRPCMGWPSLRKNAISPMLSVVIDAVTPDEERSRRSEGIERGATIPGPLLSDLLYCTDIQHLPLRPDTIDCLVLSIQDPIGHTSRRPQQQQQKPHQPTNHLIRQLAHLLSPDGICFVIVAGRITVDFLSLLQEELLSTSFMISTVRQITPENEHHCGSRVLEVGKQVLSSGSVSASSASSSPSISRRWEREGWFGIIQIQRCAGFPEKKQRQQASSISSVEGGDGGGILEKNRLTRLIETSLYLDHPLTPPEGLSVEDLEYLQPPSPNLCSLHLSNYYKWREVYPELQLMIDNFDVIQKEAKAVSSWTPWPEYHFRDGGQSDWRVVPFLHTFPATDPTKSCWIEATSSRCPETVKLLKQLSRLRTALFSKLGQATKLSAHTGWEDLANFVLRVHLTLWTPPGVCGTWVEGEVRLHEEKNFIVFDDSKVHKAFNLHPTESRVVLILDMIRPETIPPGVAVGGHTEELDMFISAFT